MPLPILGWAIAAGAAAVVGKIASSRGRKKGYTEGYNQAEAESQARINELLLQLDALQRQREQVKDQFREIVEHVSELDINDKGFFSKIAAFVRGYTYFHIYVVGSISVARARCLELSLPQDLQEELKGIIFGFIQGGFPDNLKKDVNKVWTSSDLKEIYKYAVQCEKRMPNHLKHAYQKTISDIEETVKGLHELQKKERSVQQEIEDLRSYA